jgi:predicted alpha/beta hydrolase family esterase
MHGNSSDLCIEQFFTTYYDTIMTHYFTIPGYGGSGSGHWQTYFEESQPNFQRIQQKDWDRPDIHEWADTIDQAISKYDSASIVLVAHSLGCFTVATWYEKYKRKIKAALLVAPPDEELINKKVEKKLIQTFPSLTLPFPTILVASTNDPWASIEKATSYAQKWGSELINIGDAGHINAVSGHYQWKEGLDILQKLSK